MNDKIKIRVVCVSIVIFCFFTWFLSNDILAGDDTLSIVSWMFEGGKYNLDCIFTAFMPKLFGQYLPAFLHINPHEFSMTTGAALRSFNVTVLFFVMSLFMFLGRKKNAAFPLIILLSALYFCYASSNMDFDLINPNHLPAYDLEGSFVMLTEYSHHFGQLVTFILGLFSLYYILSLFLQNQLPDKKYIVLISVFAFMTAVSSMFVCIVTGFTSLLIFIYLFAANSFKINENYKIIYIPACSYLIGVMIFAFYPGFFNYFSKDINALDFLKILFKTIILQNSLEFGLIVILTSVLYFLALNKTTFIKRCVFSVFSVILSVFFYFIMFSGLENQIEMQLTESIVLLRLMLFSLILLLLGACQRELYEEDGTRKVVNLSICIILIVFSIIQTPLIYTTMKLWRTMSEETKVTTYCLEKMYRFYSLRNKTALLPDDSLLKIFKISNFIDDINVNKNEPISGMTFFKTTPFTIYYTTFYKNSKIVPYKFINSKMALKIFFEEGGMIDSKEIKQINFQKLYDDKFVLNRAIEKAKYDI